jgi:hypothetical protein
MHRGCQFDSYTEKIHVASNYLRKPLGFCRDRMSAMLKLHQAMQEAGVLDVEKIRERINPTASPIDFCSEAIAYLNDVVGDKPLATLENAQARDLVARMKLETLGDGQKRSRRSTSGSSTAPRSRRTKSPTSSQARRASTELLPHF